jgi:hypothetical protein
MQATDVSIIRRTIIPTPEIEGLAVWLCSCGPIFNQPIAVVFYARIVGGLDGIIVRSLLT